jgi:hypothetical protein
MKAFVNFVAEQGRTYADKTETARRYRIFKENYENTEKHRVHEEHLPYSVSATNKFADLTADEFMTIVANGAVVPQAVLQGDRGFTTRKEYVPMYDKVNEELPE